MNNSLKGAFLSGMVLPGLGQIILKHYKRGAVLILAVIVSLAVIFIIALHKALAILEMIESGGGAINMSTISNAATQATTSSTNLMFRLFLLLVIFCWIIGIVDAYRIGRKKDIEGRQARLALNSDDS